MADAETDVHPGRGPRVSRVIPEQGGYGVAIYPGHGAVRLLFAVQRARMSNGSCLMHNKGHSGFSESFQRRGMAVLRTHSSRVVEWLDKRTDGESRIGLDHGVG